MLNYQLEIVGEEFVTSIGHSDELFVNLLFDRSFYRPMCRHMGKKRRFHSNHFFTGPSRARGLE